MKSLASAPMVRLFLAALFISIIFFSNQAYAAWYTQNSGTNSDLHSVYFPVLNTGYIAGDNGTVLKTTNGGIWERLNVPTTSNLTSVFFIDALSGFAAGDNVIIKTIDGGASWSIYNVTGYSLKSVHFVNSNTGFAAGYGGIFLKTTDAGISWQQRILNTLNNCNAVFFINELTGFIAGNTGLYLKTTDGGTSWESKIVPADKNFYSVQFLNSSAGYITCGWVTSTVLKSDDGGESWNNLFSEAIGTRIYTGYFTDVNSGYIAGRYGLILKTENGGLNWSQESSGTNEYLYSLNFVNPQVGYAVGANGTILSTVEVIGIIPHVTEEPKYFRLYQNYPNPFNPTTKIRFDIPADGIHDLFNVNISVFDISGRKVINLVNDKLAPGAYNIDWDASNLASGTYFYNMYTGEYSESKKLVVLK